MKKLLLIILGIAVVLVVGFFALNSFIYNEKQAKTPSNSETPNENSETVESLVNVTPISHATIVLNMGNQVIYTDPVGGAEAFAGQPVPNIILVTDIHGDHLDAATLQAVSKESTVIVVPQAVAEELPKNLPGTVVVLANGEKSDQLGINIEAIPMYNMPESSTAPHTKGRGNGYVITADGKRVYVAGDTGDTPEMRALKNIDVAFIPMNLPYTMSVESAADAVLEFKPKQVSPYHFRGSDVEKFKDLVNAGDPTINVQLLNFYPES